MVKRTAMAPETRSKQMCKAAEEAASLLVLRRTRALSAPERAKLKELSALTSPRLIEQALLATGLTESDLKEMAK